MLSSTNTISDLKGLIKNDFSYYGFSTDELFTTNLTLYIDESKLLDLYPVIGESFYSTLSAKDKVSLTLYETYIYNAELYFSASRFLSNHADSITQDNAGSGGSLSVEGYSRTWSGESGFESVSSNFQDKGHEFLSLAGHNVLQLQRNGGFYKEVLNKEL